MLPERALRTLKDELVYESPNETIRRIDLRGGGLIAALESLCRVPTFRGCVVSKDFSRIKQPETLTGDDWRTAWAEAHDAETDKALGAVY